ncbi:hypothetical protein Tco_0286933 [Tanacetum coccineum]
MGGSFDISPPRTTQAPPEGTTSGGAEDPDKLTALSSLVDSLVQKVDTQASDLKAHKLMFKEVVGKLVKKVKVLEDKIKGRKRKFVLTDSDKEEDAELDVDPLIKLAQAAATAAAVPTDGLHEADIPPSSSVPTDEFAGGSDVPAGATTGPSTVYPSSTTVPTTNSVPAAAPIPAGSGTTPESPSSPERDARKGKGIAVDKPSPTQHKTFKQLEEERLGWEAAERLQAQELADFEKQRAESLMKDANLARQMSQDFDITEAHRKRQVEFNDDDFAARMVELLQEEFDKIQRAVAFTRGFKRDGSPKARASSKKLKTGGDDVNLVATSHGVPQEEPVKAPSTTTSIAQQTASSTKKVGTKRKRFGRKGVHPSRSTIPIEDGDPEAEHKMCIKYASDADSDSDDDTPVHLHAVDKKPTGVYFREILSVHVLETVSGLVVHMFVNNKYPLTVNLIDRMLDHQLEISRDTVGNELTTVVQLITFLKKQTSYSRRPKVHDWLPKTGWFSLAIFLERKVASPRGYGSCPCFDADFLVTDSKFLKVAFGVRFKMLLFNPLVISTKDLSRNLKLTMSNSSIREDFPTSKDSSIVSTGSTKVIPAGSTILVLTSSKKYSSSIRLLHDPFISSNVGPTNNLGVRVSTLSRFITNAEKSRGVSINSLNDLRGSSIWAKELRQG